MSRRPESTEPARVRGDAATPVGLRQRLVLALIEAGLASGEQAVGAWELTGPGRRASDSADAILAHATVNAGTLLGLDPRREAWCRGASVQWLPVMGRLLWRRDGLRPLRAVVGSRPPQAVTRHDSGQRLRPWLTAIRAAVAGQRGRPGGLLAVEPTPMAPLVQVAAERLDVPLRSARIAKSWPAWGSRVRRDFAETPPVYELSPPLATPPPHSLLPVVDELAWQLAEALEVVHLRQGGAWSRRLAELSRHEHRRICLRVTAVGRPPTSALRGAVGAESTIATYRRMPAVNASHPQVKAGPRHRAASATPIWKRTAVLTHWSRARDGPWLDETWEQFYWSLLCGRQGDRSAIGVLRRIASQGVLTASSQCIRGGVRAVCLAAQTPEQLAAVWRRHRRRWDRQPFGVAIDRQQLARRGARPVIYGDESLWGQLPEWLRPYFQCRGRAGQWAAEHEWRHLGNLSLTCLPGDSVEFFVPDEAAARRLQLHCPWPVRAIL